MVEAQLDVSNEDGERRQSRGEGEGKEQRKKRRKRIERKRNKTEEKRGINGVRRRKIGRSRGSVAATATATVTMSLLSIPPLEHPPNNPSMNSPNRMHLDCFFSLVITACSKIEIWMDAR